MLAVFLVVKERADDVDVFSVNFLLKISLSDSGDWHSFSVSVGVDLKKLNLASPSDR